MSVCVELLNGDKVCVCLNVTALEQKNVCSCSDEEMFLNLFQHLTRYMVFVGAILSNLDHSVR